MQLAFGNFDVFLCPISLGTGFLFLIKSPHIFWTCSHENLPIEKYKCVSISVQWVKQPLVTPASHIRVPVPVQVIPRLWSSFLVMHLGMHQMMAEVPGSLPPMEETWMEFLSPSFSLAHPWLLWAFEEKTRGLKISVSPRYSFKHLKKGSWESIFMLMFSTICLIRLTEMSAL